MWNWTWYRIGASYELSGDRAGAKAFYARVRKSSDPMRPMDAYYYRRAQEQIARPLSPPEASLLRAANDANSKAMNVPSASTRARSTPATATWN